MEAMCHPSCYQHGYDFKLERFPGSDFGTATLLSITYGRQLHQFSGNQAVCS